MFDFPSVVEDASTIPQQYAGLYKKTDAGMVLDEDLAKRLDVTGINKALETERKSAKELKAQVALWKALGATPDEVKAKLAALEDGEGEEDEEDEEGKKTGKKSKVDIKALREKMKQDLEGSLKKVNDEANAKISKMQAALHKNMVQREAIAALAKLKGSQDLLLPHVIQRLGIVEDDEGNMTVRVVDADGDAESDGRGGFKSVETLVSEMRNDEKFARAFDSTGKGGTGAKPGNATRRTGGEGTGAAEKSATQKISDGLNSLR